MYNGVVLIYLVLNLLVHFFSAQEVDQSHIPCPKSFKCGILGNMSFPFTNFSTPDCGLSWVNCSDQTSPKVALQKWDKWYDAKGPLGDNFIKLHDPTLQLRLDDRNCWSFYHRIQLPDTPLISFAIKSNITLFRCSKNLQDHGGIETFGSSRKYEACNKFNFTIFYNNPKFDDPFNGTLPSDCVAITFPMVSWDSISDNNELFELISADFDLEWHLSDDCFDCHHKRGKSKLGVILATVAGCGLFILASAFVAFIMWRRKQGINSVPYFLSRHVSRPSRKSDDESVYCGVHIFSYAELENITNNFNDSNELGDGGFGTVYYGKLKDGREVAVKRLYEHNFKRMEQFKNEIEILTRLRHRNLVTLYGCTSRRCRELLLVYEYIPNGTVADHLHGDRAKAKPLTWPIRMNIAIETAGALAYLHASDIIHRDVKTTNILLDDNFCVKVADFGLSRLFPNDVSHISTAPQGTPGYVDPEYHLCYKLTDKSDVYSFGVVLIELISSMPAVDINRHRHEVNLANFALSRIQRRATDELIDPFLRIKPDSEVMRMTTSVAELAYRCLQLEKEMRPTMNEVVETLKAIGSYKGEFGDARKATSECTSIETSMVPPSPESDDVVLLRNKMNFPSSPNSVTDVWNSGSTSTTINTSR